MSDDSLLVMYERTWQAQWREVTKTNSQSDRDNSPSLLTEGYASHLEALPCVGNVLAAQHDDSTLIVYQAFGAAVAEHAVQHQSFGGPHYSFSRMTWIKPSFLWMMYRSGWGTKPNQERTLAIRITRNGLLEALSAGVLSTFHPELHTTETQWRADLKRSHVRVQWDPDRTLRHERLQRRTIQIGLRSEALRAFCNEWIVRIEDVSEFVAEQRCKMADRQDGVVVPLERVYSLNEPSIERRLGIEQSTSQE